VIDKFSGEFLAKLGSQGFIDQDNLADPLIKQNDIQTREAGPELMAILKQRVSFYKDNWLEDARSRGVDAHAAYDFYAKTAEESAGLMK
jgi:hypothetical protein